MLIDLIIIRPIHDRAQFEWNLTIKKCWRFSVLFNDDVNGNAHNIVFGISKPASDPCRVNYISGVASNIRNKHIKSQRSENCFAKPDHFCLPTVCIGFHHILFAYLKHWNASTTTLLQWRSKISSFLELGFVNAISLRRQIYSL